MVAWPGRTYKQKSGISIGSRVAPRLSHIILAKVDRSVEAEISVVENRAFRFVDDYLLFLDPMKKGSPIEVWRCSREMLKA